MIFPCKRLSFNSGAGLPRAIPPSVRHFLKPARSIHPFSPDAVSTANRAPHVACSLPGRRAKGTQNTLRACAL